MDDFETVTVLPLICEKAGLQANNKNIAAKAAENFRNCFTAKKKRIKGFIVRIYRLKLKL